MSRRSPGKRESLDSLATREISVIRSCRNLSALKQVGRQELFLESGSKNYLACSVDVSWRFRMTKRRAKHVGRKAMKA